MVQENPRYAGLVGLWEALKNQICGDETSERTWDCKPLLVVRNGDERILFAEAATIEVKPLGKGCANLEVIGDWIGWHPLIRATSISVTSSRHHQPGVVCIGVDVEGTAFTWYVNGAADSYYEGIVPGLRTAD